MMVSVLIPVFNEIRWIEDLLRRVAEVELPEQLSREVLVVDDGSTDGTGEALASLSKTLSFRLLRLPKNSGKGRAVRAGLAEAHGDFILLQDADLEYDPAQHPRLLAPLISGEASAVYGSRFLGSIRQMRLANRLANRFLSGLASTLYGQTITDEATGLKAFRRDLLCALDLQCEGFEFCPEVTAKLLKRNIPILEVPVDYIGRSHEQGKKIRARDGLIAAYTLLRHRF